MKPFSVWIGYDPRETAAFAVARVSAQSRMTNRAVPIRGLMLDECKARGLYWRPTERRNGKMWDVISGAHMSTEFALTRFLVPQLCATQGGLALFMDCDMLVRGNLMRIYEDLFRVPERKAVWCVKHEHVPSSDTKMDGQLQTSYPRKNWSSFMVFDCDHPANKRLSLELVNSARGLDLHQFCWLEDNEIGELDPKWNYLVGHTELPEGVEPKVVHYTDGGPWFPGFDNLPYADTWKAELTRWVCR